MPRLRKQYVSTVKGVDYHKWILNLPKETVEQMGWEHGTELEVVARKDGLFVREAEAKDND